MTADEFAEQIRIAIASIGISEFQSSFSFPDPKYAHALANLPTSEDQWDLFMARFVQDAQPGEEFMAAFLVGDEQFRVIRCTSSGCEKHTYVVA